MHVFFNRLAILCAFSNHLSLCVLSSPPSFFLGGWMVYTPINPKTKQQQQQQKLLPLSQQLSNYLTHLGEMQLRYCHFNHFNQSLGVHVSMSKCVCVSVPVEAIRWSWCLTEEEGDRQRRALSFSTCYHSFFFFFFSRASFTRFNKVLYGFLALQCNSYLCEYHWGFVYKRKNAPEISRVVFLRKLTKDFFILLSNFGLVLTAIIN